MPVDMSDSFCLSSAGVNVGIRWCSCASFPGPDCRRHRYLAEVEEVAAVELVEQITRCSSVQFGGNVQLNHCTFNIMMKK